MLPDSHSRIGSMQSLLHRNNGNDRSTSYGEHTAHDYIQTIDSEIKNSFTPEQLHAIYQVITLALPKPSPKVVDLRFGIDLLVSQFYIVLFVGQERRRQHRRYLPSKVTRVGNTIAAITLLVGLNVLVSLGIFLLAYLAKSAVGIDLFPDSHLNDHVQTF